MPDAVAGGAGPPRWQDDVEADVRRRVLEKILGKLVQVYKGRPAPSHDINMIATSFEQKMFNEASSKDDYIKKIALKLLHMERERNRQSELQDSSGLSQHAKVGHQMQPADRIQAVQGSSTTTMSQVLPTSSIHERQSAHTQSRPVTPPRSSPVPKQHTACPVAPKMNIKNQQRDAATMIPKSSPAMVTPSSSGVHSSQVRVQPRESQNQNKSPVMQKQPVNFSSGHATSVTQPKGQQVAQPNGQQNPLRQNARGTCMQPQQQMRMHQQCLEVNQQKTNRQNSQMHVARQDNDTKMQTGHPRDRNIEQNAGLNVESSYKHSKMEPQPLITHNQERGLHTATPQTVASMGSVEDDWREEMFQQMKVLKDAYFSELVELDQISAVPKITKEEFESLPKDKAEQYKFRVYMKKRIKTMLIFLQLQKSNIPEHLRGQLSMFEKAIDNVLVFYRRKKDQRADMDTGHQCHISRNKKPQMIDLTGDPAPSSGCTSSQQKKPVQSAEFQLTQNSASRTPAASPENHSNILLGVARSCVPVRSSGSAQSLPNNRLQHYCTPSPATKESPVKISSPSGSVRSKISSLVGKPDSVIGASPPVSSSPIAKPNLKVASPIPSAKSKLPLPIATCGSRAALPCTPARSTSSSPFSKAGIVKVGSPASLVSTLPSPIKKIGVAKAASPCAPLKSAQSPLGANSEVVIVASPCASTKSTSPESIETVSALLQQHNASAASNGSTTNLLMPSSVIEAKTTDLQAEDLQHGGAETPVAKRPIDRLIDAVRSLSPAALMSSADSICSVISMDDCVPDMEFNTFQQWTLSKPTGSSHPKKIKRIFEITALGPESPALADTWDAEGNVERVAKRQKIQNSRNALLDEIESANRMLMDTITSIADDNRTDGITSSSGGTLIKLSYTAMSLAPNLKSLFATSKVPIVMPTKLLVPRDYPRSSPVLVNDQRGEQLRNIFSDISGLADMAFRNTLNGIPEPRSIRETVRAWDTCVRQAVAEFAQRFGGGMFSSRCGRWESSGSV